MNMRIDRNNYEEYFILYLDNELSPSDRLMVEAFVSKHPDLEEELQLLMDTKLSPDADVVFENKLELLKDETYNYPELEEDLLLYTDNELSEEKRKAIEELAAKHQQVRTSLDLLLQTQVQPEAEVVFPNKESLYRYEEKEKVITIRWWRIAAAAVLVIALGGITYSILNKNNVDGPSTSGATATVNPKNEVESPGSTQSSTNNQSADVETGNTNTTDQLAGTNQENKSSVVNETQNNVIANNRDKKEIKEQSPLQEDLIAMAERNTQSDYTNQVTRIENTPANVLPIDAGPKTIDNKGIVKGNFNFTSPVTTKDDVALNTTEASNKKLRGVFRKATRILEKTTNVPVADEEDKLLIGGLTVKLK